MFQMGFYMKSLLVRFRKLDFSTLYCSSSGYVCLPPYFFVILPLLLLLSFVWHLKALPVPTSTKTIKYNCLKCFLLHKGLAKRSKYFMIINTKKRNIFFYHSFQGMFLPNLPFPLWAFPSSMLKNT